VGEGEALPVEFPLVRCGDPKDPLQQVPAAGIAGVIRIGTLNEPGRTTFVACDGPPAALVLDFVGRPFDRLVRTMDDPDRCPSLTALGCQPLTIGRTPISEETDSYDFRASE